MDQLTPAQREPWCIVEGFADIDMAAKEGAGGQHAGNIALDLLARV